MPEIQIDIADKIAQVRGNPVIVCGNSDYTVTFTFDAEWDAYDAKTARFVRYQNGIPVYTDVLFTGNTVNVPALYDTHEAAVGVYAGDIRTSTPARVQCMPCITGDSSGHPVPPPPDVYAQLLVYLEELESGAGSAPSNATAAADCFAVCIIGTATFSEVE